MPTSSIGCTEDAQGSCRWREGNTEVVATVDGPTHRSDRAASQDPGHGGLEIRAQLAARSSVKDRNAAEKAVEDEPRSRRAPRRRRQQPAARDDGVLPRDRRRPDGGAAVRAERGVAGFVGCARADATIPLAVSVDCGGCRGRDAGRGARRRRVLALESRGAPQGRRDGGRPAGGRGRACAPRARSRPADDKESVRVYTRGKQGAT